MVFWGLAGAWRRSGGWGPLLFYHVMGELEFLAAQACTILSFADVRACGF